MAKQVITAAQIVRDPDGAGEDLSKVVSGFTATVSPNLVQFGVLGDRIRQAAVGLLEVSASLQISHDAGQADFLMFLGLVQAQQEVTFSFLQKPGPASPTNLELRLTGYLHGSLQFGGAIEALHESSLEFHANAGSYFDGATRRSLADGSALP